MILDVNLVQKAEMFCHESMLATVAACYKRNYEMMFSEIWSLDMLPIDGIKAKEDMLSNRIYIRDENIVELFEKYHGIKVMRNNFSSSEDILNITLDNLHEASPICVSFDEKYSPWVPETLKLQRNINPYIVVGINGTKDCLYCIDVHRTKKIETLPLVNYLEGIREIHSFLISSNEYESIDVKKFIDNTLYLLYNNKYTESVFSAIAALSYEFEKTFAAKAEAGNGDEFYRSGLYRKLISIIRGRMLFSLAVKFINKSSNEGLDVISYKLQQASSKWRKILYIITRQYEKESFDDFPNLKIASYIREAGIFEEDIAKKLMNIDLDKVNPNIVPAGNNHKTGKAVYLDLKEDFNNRGFMDEASTKNITDSGMLPYDGLNERYYFFLINSQTSSVNNMEFGLPGFKIPFIPELNEFDNVSCCGQTIKVPLGQYNLISILGCSHDGFYSDSMILYYSNGDQEEVLLQFSDMNWEPGFDEVSVWNGKCIRFDCSNRVWIYESHPVRINMKQYQLSGNKMLERISLPDCPNAHIFAVALSQCA